VLVVVEDRDLERLAQPPLDLEAARRRDVLEVDATERRRDRLHRADDLVGVLRGQADREGVDIREFFEQHRLALHHGQCRLGSDVPEPEYRGAVADDGDAVALDREVPDLVRIPRDGMRDACDTRRVDHREVVPRLQRQTRAHLELAPEVGEEDTVGDLDHLDAVDRPDGGDDLVKMLLVVSQDVDIADLRRTLDPDEVDRAEQAAGLADRRGQAGEGPGNVLDAHADRGAERCRRMHGRRVFREARRDVRIHYGFAIRVIERRGHAATGVASGRRVEGANRPHGLAGGPPENC
jgi:hypothetical protein